ncbi:hypothetical protein GGR57DRAFT_159136 [Xylariaceae sp. FL1272]|nr:hypothetical protein GGR57DRAFT_159136 [Xylariaceae sp. FL1272]
MTGEEYESGSELPVGNESSAHGEMDSIDSNSLFGSDDDTAGFVTIKWDDDGLTVQNEDTPNEVSGNQLGDDVPIEQSAVDAENDLSPLAPKFELSHTGPEPSTRNDLPISTGVEAELLPSSGPGSPPAPEDSSISHDEALTAGVDYHPLPYSETQSSSTGHDNSAFPRYTSDSSSRIGSVSLAETPAPDIEVPHRPSLPTTSLLPLTPVSIADIPASVEDAPETPEAGVSNSDDIPDRAAVPESDVDDVDILKSLSPRIDTPTSLPEATNTDIHAPDDDTLENHPPNVGISNYPTQINVADALAAIDDIPSDIPSDVDNVEARSNQYHELDSNISDAGLPSDVKNDPSTHAQTIASLTTVHSISHTSHVFDSTSEVTRNSSAVITSTDVIVSEDLDIPSANMTASSLQDLPAAIEDSSINSVTDEPRLDYYTYIKQIDIELIANSIGNLQTAVDNASRLSEELRDEVLIRSEKSIPTAWAVERLYGSIEVAGAIYEQVDDTKDLLSRSYGYGSDIHDRVKETLGIEAYEMEVINTLEDAEERIRDAMKVHQHAQAVLEESGASLLLVAEEPNNPEKDDSEDQTITKDQDQDSVAKVEPITPVRVTLERLPVQESTEHLPAGEVTEHLPAQGSTDHLSIKVAIEHPPKNRILRKRRHGKSHYTTKKGSDGQDIRTLRPPKRHRTLGRVEIY